MRKLNDKLAPTPSPPESKIESASFPKSDLGREEHRVAASLHEEIKGLDLTRGVFDTLKGSATTYPRETAQVAKELLSHHDPAKLLGALTFLYESDPVGTTATALARLSDPRMTERLAAFLHHYAPAKALEGLTKLAETGNEPLRSIASRALSLL